MQWFKNYNSRESKDKRVLQIIFSDNYEMVYRTAYYLTYDEELSKDITQVTFIRAFENIDKLKDTNKFKPWIRKIAMNVSKDMLRERSKHNKKITSIFNKDGEIKDYLLKLVSFDNIEEQYESLEVVKEILCYIDSMSCEEKQILYLKYSENYTYEQIAEYMDMNRSTIGMKLLRVRKKIDEKLKKYINTEGLESNG